MDFNIFEQKRFGELLKMNEQKLFEDFLFHIKESYNTNEIKYKKRTFCFNIALYLFIIAVSAFIVFVIRNTSWR